MTSLIHAKKRLTRAATALLLATAMVMPASGALAQSEQPDAAQPTTNKAVESADIANNLAVTQAKTAKTVLLSRIDEYADALSGSSLAGKQSAPILFTATDKLLDSTKTALTSLGATDVTILGGKQAINDTVEAELTALKLTVTRVSGASRYDTALEIAKQVVGEKAPSTIFFVEGEHADPAKGWPDAINIAASAAKLGIPILPIKHGEVPKQIADQWAIWQKAGAKPILIGGTAAISEETAKHFASEHRGKTVMPTRLRGETRYGTSAVTYQYSISEAHLDPSTRVVIPGDSFIEGLAAGALAARTNHPVVMVDTNNVAASKDTLAILASSLDLLANHIVVGKNFAQPVLDGIKQAVTPLAMPKDAASCVTLLHHNDGESKLLGVGNNEHFGSLGRLVTMVDQQKKLADTNKCPSVMVSSGDNFLAGPALAASKPSAATGKVYDSIGMSYVGYDAIDIGNHDLDFGPEFLARFISSFTTKTPFLSANLDVSNVPSLKKLQDEGRIAPSLTVTLSDGSKVGIIGLTTQTLRSISSPGKIDVLQDVAGIVQKQIDTFKANQVERIILISHLQGIQADYDLISQLSGLDAVVAGGGDEILAGNGEALAPGDMFSKAASYPVHITDKDGHIVPTVTTAGDYKYLGRLTLYFGKDGELVTDMPYNKSTSRMMRINDESLPQGVARDQRVVDEVETHIRKHVADLEKNIVAQSEVGLNGVRPDIRVKETNLGNLVADAHRFTAMTNAKQYGLDETSSFVAFQNGGGIRNNNVIAKGDITELTTFDILPFGNFIGAVPNFTVAKFKPILERGYSGIERVAGGFIHVSDNVKVEIDISKPAQEIAKDDKKMVTVTKPGERVRTLVIDGTEVVKDGKVIKPDFTFTLVSIDFSLRNGDAYPFNLKDGEFTTVGTSYQQALYNYLVTPVAEKGLGGKITTADYPEGGEGRLVITGEAAK